MSRLELARKFAKEHRSQLVASRIATRDLITTDALSVEEMAELSDLYPAWATAIAYKLGEIIQFDGTLYVVIQAHTSQADWTPPIVPALFKSTVPVGVIPDWVQPTGAHDAYQINDLVTFEGAVYKSLIDANTWSPTAYPQGWELQP